MIDVTNSIELAPRMLPELTPVNRPFWTGGSAGQLLILRDQKTGEFVHPPELVGADGAGLAAEPVSGKGSIFAFTVNRHAYNPEIPVPYIVALVELDEQPGLRVPTNIISCEVDEVHIGMRVKVLFEERGEIFVPLFEPDG